MHFAGISAAAFFSRTGGVGQRGTVPAAKPGRLQASLLISLDMQLDLHIISDDPRSLNHLVPG
jgi:hypothetical protein